MSDLLALLPPGPPLILWDGDRAVLAEQALEGVLSAEAYQRTEPMHCTLPVADLTSHEGQRVDQLIYGEVFDVLHREAGRVWGRARRDGMIGWVDMHRLKPGAPLATHRVAAVDTRLPLNALVREGVEGLDGGAIRPVEDFETDLVSVAERLLGCPYLLGGRTALGTDCSGLVQQALLACGQAGPRRTEAQSRLGQPIERVDVRRNDLALWLRPEIEWIGHSALIVDTDTVIHATSHHGEVVVEALAQAEARLISDGFAPAIFRRL